MNARLTALFVAGTLVIPSIAQAGQNFGPAKARGDFGNFQSQGSTPRWAAQARSNYRDSSRSYGTPRYSAPIVREVPSADAIAQAPVEARRFSQAPAAESDAVTNAQPCPESSSVVSQPGSGRRYSYAPTTGYSGGSVRSYSGSTGPSFQPQWALPKTHPGKYNSR